MPKAIITPKLIQEFLEIAPTIMASMTQDANKNGTFFWADCRVKYRQEFDIESEKGVRGAANATTAPGVTIVGDANADAFAGVTVEKDREGFLSIDTHLKYRSEKALAQSSNE